MTAWLGLIAGGVCGTVARYLLSTTIQRSSGGGMFPLGTLAVNATGCLIIGWIAAAIERQPMSEPARLFWTTGLLGAFTTFSALIHESAGLLRAGQPLLALANLLLSVGLGFAAYWLGLRLGGG